MTKLRIAVIGTGFWSNFQVPAWGEVDGAGVIAVYNRTLSKANEVAQKFGIKAAYDDAAEMLDNERPDVVDIISNVETHLHFTRLAAEKGIDVICQKPMAASLHEAEEMLRICKANGVKLLIHENFRWQAPMRALKEALDSGVIGRPFKARVSFCSAFPVFDNQPALARLKQFILTDIGSHVLDICRFLFGEAASLSCLTQKVHPEIDGEDVANVLMQMKNGVHCFAELSYASVLEQEAFPQTLALIEGDKGSLHLTNNFVLKTSTRKPPGTVSRQVDIPQYAWADPEYAIVHSCIVDCNRNLLQGLKGGHCETTGEDNLKTTALVWAAYDAAAGQKTIRF